MSAKIKLFLILLAAGLVGVGSFLFVDLHALISAIPVPAGEVPPELPSPGLLKIASVIQPAVIATIAVAVGVLLSPKVGLHAPVAEALSRGEAFLAKLGPQVLPGVIAGIGGGIGIVALWVVAKPFLSAEFISRAEGFNRLLPHITRFLYGGVTEEILLRWGLMTFLVWAAWRLFQRGEGTPRPFFVIGAIFVSALVFGIGHLLLASMLAGGLTLPLVAYVIAANSLFGIFAGFLYWRRGLESAMIAHMFAHVVLIAAIHLSF